MIRDERIEEIRAGKLGRLKAVQELLDDREVLLRENRQLFVVCNERRRRLERAVTAARNLYRLVNSGDIATDSAEGQMYHALNALDEEEA